MNDIEAAKILISCLDLTSLGDKDTDVKIEETLPQGRHPLRQSSLPSAFIPNSFRWSNACSAAAKSKLPRS